jgi:NDP-sugar pyrophosphorylase family protein
LSLAPGPELQNNAKLEAVILAGGLGIRLRHVLSDRPKILAPIGNRPFLDHLLEALVTAGVTRVLLCLGHLADKVISHLCDTPPPLPVSWVIEKEPLGTGGALRLALPHIEAHQALVMNGDTWIGFDLPGLLRTMVHNPALGAVVYAEVNDVTRYGRLEIDADGFVQAFLEKDTNYHGGGAINGGIYLLTKKLLEHLGENNAVSLERDFLERLPPRSLLAYKAHGSFIDIGTPEDLVRAPTVVGGAAFGRASLDY